MTRFYGSEGNDTIHATNQNDSIWGKGGRDRLFGQGGNDSIYGQDGVDRLYGGPGDDRLNGGALNDYLYGEDGNDSLYGGPGDDVMVGGRDNDTYTVDSVRDIVRESSGYRSGIDTVIARINDYVLPDNVENLRVYATGNGNSWSATGNSLNNRISLNAHVHNTRSFSVRGGGGHDTISGSHVRDWVYGESGDDTLLGQGGDDHLYGSFGKDTVTGGAGNDFISGGAGSDILVGNDGNDTLFGYDPAITSRSRGDLDKMSGGAGLDRFILGAGTALPYALGSGHAEIQDFNRFQDKIQLAGRVGHTLYSLGVGDFDGDGRRDDTAIYFGAQSQNSIVGTVINNVSLSLNASYFEYR